MKKTLGIILVIMFVLSISSIALAVPSNQFADVPADNWAYEAVSKLAKTGIINGYDDKYFHGDRILTRYEMAQIVANAITKEEKADAEQKVLIEKLAVEFKVELDKLGVRVSVLEKKASTFKMTGYARIRYQENDGLQGYSSPAASAKNASRFNTEGRLLLSGDINDSTAVEGRLIARIQNADVGNANNDRNGFMEFSRLNVTFKNVIPTSNLTIGRQNILVANGLMFGGDYFDGAKLTFGNQLKGFVAYGDYSYMPGPTYADKFAATTVKTANVLGLQYNSSKDTTLFAGYYGAANGNAKHENYTVGFKTNLDKKLTMSGDYTKNNYKAYKADDSADKTAWFTTLQYGKAEQNKPGTYGLWTRYSKIGKDSIDWTTAVVQYATTFNTITTGVEGFSVGFDYTMAKNAILNIEYDKWKGFKTATYSNARDYKPFIQVVTQFWF